jgi:hypothetical protein
MKRSLKYGNSNFLEETGYHYRILEWMRETPTGE